MRSWHPSDFLVRTLIKKFRTSLQISRIMESDMFTNRHTMPMHPLRAPLNKSPMEVSVRNTEWFMQSQLGI
jgi:hypothetical protein